MESKDLTVGDLIAELQKLDPALKAVVVDYDGGDHCHRFVTGVKVVSRPEVDFGTHHDPRRGWVPNYTPAPTERFAQIWWGQL